MTTTHISNERPTRIRRDWNAAVMRHCDYCAGWEMTVLEEDGGNICAGCCDNAYTSTLADALDAALAELLAARATIAAMSEQPPVAWTDDVELRDVAKSGFGYIFKNDPGNQFADPRRQIMLYAAQPPAVVPYENRDEFAEKKRAVCDEMKMGSRTTNHRFKV